MQWLKSKIYYLVILSIIFIFAKNLFASNDILINEITESTKRCVDEINSLVDVNKINYLYGLNDTIEKAKMSNSAFDIISLFDNYIQRFIEEKKSDQISLSENEVDNLIIALNSWAYIYEPYALFDDSFAPRSLIGISGDIQSNLDKRKYILEYTEWINQLMDARTKALSVITENNASFVRGFYLGFTLGSIKLIDRFSDWSPSYCKKALVPYNGLIGETLPNTWYFFVREYVNSQDGFYLMRKRTEQIISFFKTTYSNNRVALNKLNKYSELSDLYFKNLDFFYRSFAFDLPVWCCSLYYFLQFNVGKEWFDDEDLMQKAVIDYSKLDFFKYTVLPLTQEDLLYFKKMMKKEYNDREWDELVVRAKLNPDWYNLFARVNSPLPDNAISGK